MVNIVSRKTMFGGGVVGFFFFYFNAHDLSENLTSDKNFSISFFG